MSVASWADALAAPPGSVLALVMPVDRGFRRDGVLAVAAADLLGSRADRDDTVAGPGDTSLFTFGNVRVGDVIVHEDHGIAMSSGWSGCRPPAMRSRVTRSR